MVKKTQSAASGDKDLKYGQESKYVQWLFIFTYASKTLLHNNNKKIVICLQEGKNHVVKRLFEKLNNKVLSLHRISFAGLELGNLNIGKYRKLSYIEIQNIKNKYGHEKFS